MTTAPSKHRLLLVAPTCDGDDVGESWVTFQWVRRLADRHDVTVLTYAKRSARPLSEQLTNARVVEWLEPRVVGRFERFNSMLNPGYVPFYLRARRWIHEATTRGDHFDLGHQLAPVALRYPSPLAGTGIPYILGPVGGSLTSPPAFAAEEGGAPWFTGLRALDGFRLHHDARLRRSFEDAACVLGIAQYVRDLLSELELKDFRVVSDTGVEDLPLPAPGSDRTRGVRLLYVGRVIRTKGVRDAVRAVSHLPVGSVILDVVGDGYDREACEKLAASLNIDQAVSFHGAVPHAQVVQFYSAADVFLFPSYREAGGIVVTEAMAHGLPVVVCDAGGPASTVDDHSGIRVPAQEPEQYARDLASAVGRLVSDPALRHELGQSARRRIGAIGKWDNKVATVEEIYTDVVARARAALDK